MAFNTLKKKRIPLNLRRNDEISGPVESYVETV